MAEFIAYPVQQLVTRVVVNTLTERLAGVSGFFVPEPHVLHAKRPHREIHQQLSKETQRYCNGRASAINACINAQMGGVLPFDSRLHNPGRLGGIDQWVFSTVSVIASQPMPVMIRCGSVIKSFAVSPPRA